MSIQKQLILALSTILSVTAAWAQTPAPAGYISENISIGTSLDDVQKTLHATYGKPDKATDTELIYHNKQFHHCKYDVLIFTFTDGKLSEARFYIVKPTFSTAQQEMESIARRIDSKWPLSKDREGKHTWFYVGGIAPSGIGHLLALHTYKTGKNYHTELRFGPFKP